MALILVLCAGGCVSSGRYIVDEKVLASIEEAPEKVTREADGTRTIGDAQVRVAWHPGDDTGRRPHYSGEVSVRDHHARFDDLPPPDRDLRPDDGETLDQVAAELVRRDRIESQPLPAVRESDGQPVLLRAATLRERSRPWDGSRKLKVVAAAPNGLATGGLVLGATGATLTVIGAALDQPSTPCTQSFQLFCGGGNQFTGQLLLGVGVVTVVSAVALAVAALTRHPQEMLRRGSSGAESTF